jgi:hypothetical protein
VSRPLVCLRLLVLAIATGAAGLDETVSARETACFT